MRNGAVGWLLVVGSVVLGILAMHAVVAPPAGHPAQAAQTAQTAHAVHVGQDAHSAHPPAGAPPGEDQGTGPEHLRHLCLAVLAAAGMAVVAWWLLIGRIPGAFPRPAWRGGRGVPVQRPPPVRTRLARLCVIRS